MIHKNNTKKDISRFQRFRVYNFFLQFYTLENKIKHV